jgi:hypothetical protein
MMTAETASMQDFLELKANFSALKTFLEARPEGQSESAFDSGDTAWMLTSTAFGNISFI